jgi:cytochrome c oxidase cbb3-type subunit 1
MGGSLLVAFHGRRERVEHFSEFFPSAAAVPLYPSQWFIVAALFWFPWIYSASNLLLLVWPVRGVVQSIVNAWYIHGALMMWLGFIALAAIFYFIPKLLQRPLANWAWAVFAFWSLLLLSTFTAASEFVGSSVPAWFGSVGIAANLMVLPAIVLIAAMWHLTTRGAYALAWRNPALRFILFAAASYLIVVPLHIITGLREVALLTHLTYIDAAVRELALFGFVGMALLGALHYLLPRVVQRPWPSPAKVDLQFWLFAAGTAVVFVALTVGGLLQGAKLSDISVPMVRVARLTIPFVGTATLGFLLLFAGAIVFALHLRQLVQPDVLDFRARAIKEVRS